VAQPGRKRNEDSPYGGQALRLAAGLRSWRERSGLTQEQLAARAQVAVATVRKIEAGTVINPGIFTVMAMFSALGAEPEDVAGLVSVPGLELPGVTTDRARHAVPWTGSWTG
jgi:transcriptional regulator with XRE-family HTH domain